MCSGKANLISLHIHTSVLASLCTPCTKNHRRDEQEQKTCISNICIYVFWLYAELISQPSYNLSWSSELVKINLIYIFCLVFFSLWLHFCCVLLFYGEIKISRIHRAVQLLYIQNYYIYNFIRQTMTENKKKRKSNQCIRHILYSGVYKHIPKKTCGMIALNSGV